MMILRQTTFSNTKLNWNQHAPSHNIIYDCKCKFAIYRTIGMKYEKKNEIELNF